MKRIRILFAVGSLGGGGSERQTIYLLRGLDRERFDPVLYLLERRGELTEEAPSDVPSFAFSDDFVPPRFNWPGRIRAAQVAHVRKILRRERIDVVCERGIVTTLAVAPAAKAEGVPRVATFAAEPNFDLADQAKRFRFFKKRLLKRAYAEASALVALTGDVADRAAALYGLDRDRIRVIFNPVDCERIDRLAGAEPTPIGDDGNFHVVAAARLKAEKGFGHLIRAADELVHRRGHDGLRVHILGQGPEEANLRKLIGELGLEEHVRLVGFVANPFAWFRGADLFCMPSETEGMPNVLLEAIACRTPVLSTDCVSGPRDILDGGRYGRLVPPGDSKALADGIDDAMTNHESWQATVEPARKRVETEFSLPATTRKYEELFEAAAARVDARTAPVSRLPETGKDG